MTLSLCFARSPQYATDIRRGSLNMVSIRWSRYVIKRFTSNLSMTKWRKQNNDDGNNEKCANCLKRKHSIAYTLDRRPP